MKRSELITKVSLTTGYAEKVVENILKSMTEEITTALKNNDYASLHGFGKFVTRQYKARKCYNPISGEIEMLKPSTQPAFVPGPKLRKELNK